MKTLENLLGTQLSVTSAYSISSGYGHKRITVELDYKGNINSFTDITSNMPAHDDAMDLEGQSKKDALFAIIFNQQGCNDEVNNWIHEIDEQ